MNQVIYFLTHHKISKKRIRINQFIRVPQVRLLDENNKQVGIVSTQEALRMSEERGFDLVEIAPLAHPPVCQLMDYGAFKYRQEKAVRKSKAKQKKIVVKGIRLTLTIGQHDFDHRVNQAKNFLAAGDKVKIEMLLRGRQMQHQDRAREKFDEFIKQLENVNIEQALLRQGKSYSMLIGTNAQTKNP
ncbi:translation initiation factor IF-3 [Patescibacteria group bacterium]|nr:translation initiation factor IF-3 [Patescibacteria group bacterium]MBU1891063.1 translation initiation factor IF-3 [Patescibacteria group bacterium]